MGRKPQEDLDARQFELLQTIAAMRTRPSLAEIGREFGFTRQWAWKHIERLRERGLVAENEGKAPEWGICLTHNGKVYLERALNAGLRH